VINSRAPRSLQLQFDAGSAQRCSDPSGRCELVERESHRRQADMVRSSDLAHAGLVIVRCDYRFDALPAPDEPD